MTSLLLGVIAIFYSFVSNDSMSRSLGSISTITNEVREVRNEIGDFVKLTEEATEGSSQNTALVKDASFTLNTSLASLNETLNALSTQNETLKTLVSSLPTRIDQLETKVGDVAKAMGEKPMQAQAPVNPTDLSARAVDLFLSRATLNQNLLTYACVLAETSKKPLSIDEFVKIIGWNGPNQLQGFLHCMHAIQLCARKTVELQEKTYIISAVHPELKTRARPYYAGYIATTYSDDLEEQQKWMDKLAKLESLYV
jgi:hypothetical protein